MFFLFVLYLLKDPIKNYILHGERTRIFPNGESYTGQMKNNLSHGFGTYFSLNGEKWYEGDWKYGKIVYF